MFYRNIVFFVLIPVMFDVYASHDQSPEFNFDSKAHQETIKHFDDDFCAFVLDSAPIEIRDKIELLKDYRCPQQLKPTKILLYGPSGSGKTTLAQVIAQEIKRPCILINAGLLGNEYKNSTVQNLRRAIEPYLTIPCVIIIDEIDCITKQTKNDKDPDLDTPKQVWEMLDICAQFSHVLLIGITNDITGMPEPLQTRFAGDTIEIPLTNSRELRKKMIFFHLRDAVFWQNDSYYDDLAKKTNKFSYRELEKLVINAMALAYLRKSSPYMVDKRDFENAFNTMQKSRSLLKQWSWSDYKKPLQYGLQIAGLAISIVSLIVSWRSSWLSYVLSEKTFEHQKEHAQESIKWQIASFNQAADLAKKSTASNEKIAASSNKIAQQGIESSASIAQKQMQHQGPGLADALSWGINAAQNQPKSLHQIAASKGWV